MTNLQSELATYRKAFENELKNDILKYWMEKGIDKINGGFCGAADLNGNQVLPAKKSCVLNARILWTFSSAAMLYPDPEYGQMADLAWSVLQDKFADKKSGGYYMELNPDNTVANDIKHTYVQAFVIYAMSRYFEFRKSEKVLKTIKDFFFLLESMALDSENKGYIEAFTAEWSVYNVNRMADNNEPKSMNTHLHVLEAWASLYRIWKNEVVKKRLFELMDLFISKIIRKEGHLGIFFSNDFSEADSSKGICSFGHDIEASWLLLEAAELLGNYEIIEKMRPLSLKMAEAVWKAGLDRDGGLFLESTRFGSHLRTNKHWWLQAETLVGFMNAFEISGNEKYWETVKLSWNFIDSFVIDHQRGEWYTKVNRFGIPFLEEPPDDPSPYYRNDWKIDPWKCPYHNGRAMMELIRRIDKIIAN